MHGFGAWIRCTGMAMAKEKKETEAHEECINTAFLHCNCSPVDSSLSESPPLHLHSFFRPPTHGNFEWPTTVAVNSLCIACNLHGSNVANEVLIHISLRRSSLYMRFSRDSKERTCLWKRF